MDALGRWSSCGAAALTGDADRPLAVDSPAAVLLDRLLAPAGLSAEVLGERAAEAGFTRHGRRSCGGATRLLRAADGWVALALARDDDLRSLPALGFPEAGSVDEAWATVEPAMERRTVGEVVESAVSLGMACAGLGECGVAIVVPREPAVLPGRRRAPLVVDLGALWAGPFCADLLRRAGATVIKVEDIDRPDPGRRSMPRHFRALNGGKRSVALRFASPDDRALLRELVMAADVVVTSARARAFGPLGLDPEAFVGGGTDRVWVAVTGHGWASPRVGFGDDAAVAAGLVAWDPLDDAPRFAADAIADPLTGAVAATLALGAWVAGGRHLLDVPLAAVAAAVAPAAGVPAIVSASPPSPVPRAAVPAVAALGADNAAVLRDVVGIET